MIDLHTHTIHSDGTYTPKELIHAAKKTGLLAIAITDHDTVAGVEETVLEGKKAGVEVIPGIEISAKIEAGTLHLLGLFIDIKNKSLLTALSSFQRNRQERIPKMLAKLRDMKIDISETDVKNEAGHSSPGRPHVASVMMKKGHISSIEDGFERFLGRNAPAYVSKESIEIKSAIELIHEAGGLAILAHPDTVGTGQLDDLDKRISEYVSYGLDGIEAYYPSHSRSIQKHLLLLIKRHNLAISGGTDFHGENRPEVNLGDVPDFGKIPYQLLVDLKKFPDKKIKGPN